MAAQELGGLLDRETLRKERMAIRLTPLQEAEAGLRFAGKLTALAARNSGVQLVSAAGVDVAINIASKCPVSPQSVAIRLALGFAVIGLSALRRNSSSLE